MNILVACSARKTILEHYIEPCQILLNELFKRDHHLVFGACDDGLMGIAYFTALEHQREIIGVAPQYYTSHLQDLACTEKIYTNTIDQRTDALVKHSDIALFLPGGTGTIYEFFNILEKKKHHEITHPIIIYNCLGFYDHLIEFLEQIYQEQFSDISSKKLYQVFNQTHEIIAYFDALELK